MKSPQTEPSDVLQLESLQAKVRAVTSIDALTRDLGLLRGLRELGFATPPIFLRLLRVQAARHLSNIDFDALRALSHEPQNCRFLLRSRLGSLMLHMASFPAIRCRLSTRLVLEMNHVRDFQEEEIWRGAFPIVAAIDQNLIQVRRFASVQHYLRTARKARRLINSAAYHFPPGPFELPPDWKWLESGADVQMLTNLSKLMMDTTVEFNHSSARERTSYLLRGPDGTGWVLCRMSAGAV